MTDVDAIRDALAAIADEAPAAERVRSTLAARARVRRQRRVLLTAGGLATAGAAAGVVGYVAVRRRPHAGPAEPAPGTIRVPYAYHPDWLPDGVGLNQLGAVVENGAVRQVSRRWQPPGVSDGALGPSVELVIGADLFGGVGPYDGAKPFDINGVEGKFKIRAFPSPPATDRRADLAWSPPDAPSLRVRYEGDGSYEDDDPLVRVARSVRPDGRSFLLNPRFGWLPDPYAAGTRTVRIGARDGGWNQEVTVYPAETAATAGGPPPRGLTVEMGTAHTHTVPMDDARPQPVRGLDGRYRSGVLAFTLPDDVAVLVYGLEATDDGPAPPDLLRVAEEFDFGDWPDMSWAGTR